jgi:DNA-directed RNA polymerase delta subunit
MEKVGGISTYDNIVEMVLPEGEQKTKQKNSLYFLLLLNNKFVQLPDDNHINKSFILDSINIDHLYKTIDEAVSILDGEKRPVEEKQMLKLLKEKKIRFEDTSLVSALTLSKKILKTEEGHFGLSHWREINPRSIRDKTYYILKKYNKPLHFEDISKHVEEFTTGKKVTKQAVHNELIRDERFVLIGRGIYALSEWGYNKGVVEEVIEEILILAGKPLHKDEIIKEVLKRRVVKETTILLNLQKNRFKRVARATYTVSNQEG